MPFPLCCNWKGFTILHNIVSDETTDITVFPNWPPQHVDSPDGLIDTYSHFVTF